MSKKNLIFLVLIAFVGLQNSAGARVGTQAGLNDTQIAQVKKIVEIIQAQKLTSHEVELLIKEVVAEESVETIGSLGVFETLYADPLLLAFVGMVAMWWTLIEACNRDCRSCRNTVQAASGALRKS